MRGRPGENQDWRRRPFRLLLGEVLSWIERFLFGRLSLGRLRRTRYGDNEEQPESQDDSNALHPMPRSLLAMRGLELV